MADSVFVSNANLTIPVQSASVVGTSLSLVLYTQASDSEAAQSAFQDILGSSSFVVKDDTAGSTYNFSGLSLASFVPGFEPGAYDAYAALTFASVTPAFPGMLIGTPPSPCFATGTLITTPGGPVAVDDLAPGDTVTLATGGTASVVWLGHRRQHDGTVIRVRARSLGDQTPTRDLIVSADHGLHLDGVLVQAGLLTNGETIVAEHRDVVTLWHVELERHGIMLAEGAPAESYFDTGNRRQFGNCPIGYDPVAARQEPCAEMVFAGERLEVIRAGLAVMA